MSTVLIKFRDKGKHLGALFNKMESRKLGKLKIFPVVGDCGKTQKDMERNCRSAVRTKSFLIGILKTS